MFENLVIPDQPSISSTRKLCAGVNDNVSNFQMSQCFLVHPNNGHWSNHRRGERQDN